MSQRQTLAIVEALLRDDALGLRSTVERLAASLPNAPTGNPGPLSSDFTFFRGRLPGIRPANGGGNVMLRPVRWTTNERIGQDALTNVGGVREGTVTIEIGFEYFAATPEDNVDEVTLVATALAQCLDQLRDFSDAHQSQFGSCVVGIVPSMDWSFGDFEGPTSYGFICRLSVQEFSRND